MSQGYIKDLVVEIDEQGRKYVYLFNDQLEFNFAEQNIQEEKQAVRKVQIPT